MLYGARMDLNLKPDDGPVGDDGLTEKQVEELARRYRKTVANPVLSPEVIKAWNEWKAKDQ